MPYLRIKVTLPARDGSNPWHFYLGWVPHWDLYALGFGSVSNRLQLRVMFA